jgi:hypothetical protein
MTSNRNDVERARQAMRLIRLHLDNIGDTLKSAEARFSEVAKELEENQRVGGAEIMLIDRLLHLKDEADAALGAADGFYDEDTDTKSRRPSGPA